MRCQATVIKKIKMPHDFCDRSREGRVSYLSTVVTSLKHGTAFPVMHVKHFLSERFILFAAEDTHPV